MASFSTGAGTIQATTLESAVLIACYLLQATEETNPLAPDNICRQLFYR